VRHARGVVGVRDDPHPIQRRPIEAPDEPAVVGAEGEGVADENELHADQTEDEERVGEGRERVALADQARVEEAERRCHQHDERR